MTMSQDMDETDLFGEKLPKSPTVKPFRSDSAFQNRLLGYAREDELLGLWFPDPQSTV